MCKLISSDSIIGNFVIESLKKEDFQIELQKLYDFDEQLSERLEKHSYYTNFDLKRVLDFKDNYPFLVESMDDKHFNIVKETEKKDEFYSMLIRYFRLGMPKVVIQEMKTISQLILG